MSRFPDRISPLNTESLIRGMSQMPAALRQMGFDSLRPGQQKVTTAIMGERDVLVVMPTAGGKSACFVVPTLCLGWRTIVFSPLLALMRDQVKGLWARGIKAAQVSSNQTDGENELARQAWARGEVQFLYAAPEQLNNQLFKDAIRTCKPDMVTVDEAHVLSDWSDNFRAAYKVIGDYIREASPKVVSAFTATCPPEVEADIRRVLGMEKAYKILHYTRRENLQLQSTDLTSNYQILDALKEVDGCKLVYCSTVARLTDLAKFLSEQFDPGLVTFYHGQMDATSKRVNMDRFMAGAAPICVATNAFGMGVDKADIRMVLHRDHPDSPEALQQEVGRAGRDGKPSICRTFFAKDSLNTQQFFFRNGHPSRNDITRAFNVYKQAADASGLCTLGTSEVATRAGIHAMLMGAVRSVLIGDKVIASARNGQKIATIRFTGSSEDQRFRQWREQILMLGIQDSAGDVDVDLVGLADQLIVSEQTLRRVLNDWHEKNIIAFAPPPRSPPVKIIGTLEQVDFARLAKKAEDDKKKLDLVLEYNQVPDSAKHRWFEDYFKVTLSES